MVVKGSSDKFIYVTGCDTGFGAILTEQLDNLGFSVLSGVYTQEGFDKIKKERSSNVRPIKVDVSDEKSVENCGKEITRIITDVGGTLHGVVNNAGILVQPGPTEWTPNEAYRQMFNVNIMGTVMTTKSLLPLLRKSQGRILNVASIAGRVGLPTEPAYCMSKYGVEGYSEVLRKDMLVWGVTVHIIEPGVFKNTGLYGRFQTGLDKLWENLSPELKKEYGEAHYKDIRESMGTALYNGNSRSEMVVEAMVHALTADKPKYRYKVGNDSKYILSILEKCHEATQDKLLAPAKGVKPVGAPANGRQVAEGRYEKNWPRFILIVLIIAFLLRKARM